jgi:hypothetical protein
MTDIVDRLLELSPEELSQWRKRRSRGSYKKRPRPERSKEKLAKYLKDNGFKTREQLRRGRHDGDPTDDDYRKAYGSWTAAVAEIWNIQPVSRKYLLKAVIEFGLWTREAYLEAREKRPDVFPSVSVIKREFGSWGAMKEVASAMSVRRTLEAYIVLKKRLGKKPNLKDCQMAGLVIESAVKLYGGKNGLDKFVDSLEEII